MEIESSPRQYTGSRPNPVVVFAKEFDTDIITEYKSMYSASKDLGIHPGLIKMCCDGTNRVKSGFSKKNGKRYTFSYAF